MIKLLSSNLDFSDHQLLLPSVSVGNVGQLCVDLIITNSDAKLVGRVSHKSILPVVGKNPYDETSDELMTACDVYHSTSLKLVIVQIRAPLLKGDDSLLESLIDWSKEKQIRSLILVTASHSYERIDSQIVSSTTFRYLTTESVPSEVVNFLSDDLQWKRLESRPNFPSLSGVGENAITNGEVRQNGNTQDVFIPGGGFAETFHSLCSAKKVPLVSLILLCSEGNNIPEAVMMANSINLWQHWFADGQHNYQWKFPVSWKSLFGPPLPDNLF